jgi:hypothetical protein
MAPRIKLRTTLTTRAVQRNNFMPHKIIPELQTRGNRVVHALVWRGDEWCDSPLILQPYPSSSVCAVSGVGV